MSLVEILFLPTFNFCQEKKSFYNVLINHHIPFIMENKVFYSAVYDATV